MIQEGYLKVTDFSFKKENTAPKEDKENENESADEKCDAELTNLLTHLKKGDTLSVDTYEIKEGETSPPKRYTSGSIILTMENAGQFIEDEELRAQIKGSGIGTSATRAEILKKLVNIEYLAWADFTNDFLERNGSPERIDHRSNAERGIDERKFPSLCAWSLS